MQQWKQKQHVSSGNGSTGSTIQQRVKGQQEEPRKVWGTGEREVQMPERVQFSSVAQSSPTLCDPMNYSTSDLPVHHHLPEFTQTQVHWVCDAIQPSHSRLSPSPPAPNPSQHQSFPMSQLFTWGGQSTGVSAGISKEIPGLISFRMDWLDLFAVQGTLKSLLQHHSSKPSILQHSAFFTVQLSHPYINTGKTIALTNRTLVGKVMSLLLNILSRLVITRCSRYIFNYIFKLQWFYWDVILS